jgi:molecular chaperone DnaK (HSP70)
MGEREVRVLATDGEHRLGGKDWDDKILRYVAAQFADETGLDLFDDVESCNGALVAAERAKLALSERQETSICVERGGERRRYPLTREKFEEISSDLLERTAALCNDVLTACSPPLAWSDLTGALLVGGSTRLLAVQRFIENLTGKPALRGVNVDEAVAIGAALQAVADLEEELESGGYELETVKRRPNANALTRRKLEDVASRSLGLIAENSDRSKYVNSVVIKKNSPIPTEEVKRHKLRIGDPASAKLEVYLLQGDAPAPLDCLILDKYDFTGFDAEPTGEALIDVAYRYNRNGVVEIEATQVSTGKALKKSVQPIPEDMSWVAKAPKDLARRVVVPTSIVFAVDVSGSMRGEPIRKACDAFHEFVDKLYMQATKIAVLAFANYNDLIQDFCSSSKELKDCAKTIEDKVYGGNLATPFEKALFMLRWQTGKRLIVVLTDGR